MKPNNPTGPYLPIIYTSLPQTGGLLRGERAFDIRGRVGAPPPLISVRRLLNKFDAYGPSDARLLTSLINRVFWVRFLVTWLAGLFGLLGLALACIGEYGLISYAVARQTREIGMRIAFGASPGQICWLIWSRAMLPVSIGIGIGLIAAIIAIRAFGSILFGLTVIDSAAFASAMLALGSLAALAAYLPARRASRMEASVALRYE
jgi:hypothetical protein